MITRLPPGHILQARAAEVLADPPPTKASWFSHILSLTTQYGLPHPSSILASPISKGAWKGAVKRAVHSYWLSLLQSEASALPSLSHLRCSHLSLSSPHPHWTTAPSGPYPTKQASLAVRVLSGRYQSCYQRRHWDGSQGCCRLPGCGSPRADIQHIFGGTCPALAAATQTAVQRWCIVAAGNPPIHGFLSSLSAGENTGFCNFIFDPSTHPAALSLAQTHGHTVWPVLMFLSRSWLWEHHSARHELLGLKRFLI